MIRETFLRFAPFTDAHLDGIMQYIQKKTVAKDARILNEGQTCDTFFFVTSGGLRHYTLLDDGSEATLNLAIGGDWLFDHESLMAQKPSRNIIQATEDTELCRLSLHDCHRLMQTSEIYFRLGRILEQGVRYQPYLSSRLSPEEKYSMLMEQKPGLLQQFPLKYIASYLEMTPETLSRVRRKLI